MKKSLQIFALLFCIIIFAQAPEKFSYQAVIRNASNALVTNANVGMKISILKSSAAGTVVYAETQTATTNVNGLVSLQIGAGTIVTGTIAGINWSNDSNYIKTETDPTGGTNYTIAGTSQLLSVPYAMFAKSSASGAAFTLPYAGTSSANNVTPFKITNNGTTANSAGYFENTDVANTAPAITAVNKSTGGLGTGIKGIANANTNGSLASGVRGDLLGTGTDGAGVFGNADNGYGVYGSSIAGAAVRGYSNVGTAGSFEAPVSGKALATYGKLQFANNSEGQGKVLTSDATGNATWQDASSKSVGISASGLSTYITLLDDTWVTIDKWTNFQEDGGANYNVATGEYTITKDGVYQINAQVTFLPYYSAIKTIYLGINTNGTGIKPGMVAVGSNGVVDSLVPSPTLAIAHRFVAGDKITIIALQKSGATQFIENQYWANQMSIQYLHK